MLNNTIRNIQIALKNYMSLSLLSRPTRVKLDGCIVWNPHNTVFGSKRPAICALAVYFLHSTLLVSHDSIVDRHWLPATDCCRRYLPCCQPVFVVAENLGEVSCMECTSQGNDFELIPTVKMEPYRDHLVMNFCRSIIIAELWRLEVARRWKKNHFLGGGERPLTGKYSKFCSVMIHCHTDRRVVFKFREIWPTGSLTLLTWQKNKISPGSPALATARITPKISCQGQHQTMFSECFRFHPNRFTFGGVMSERVNTVRARSRVNPMFGLCL